MPKNVKGTLFKHLEPLYNFEKKSHKAEKIERRTK